MSFQFKNSFNGKRVFLTGSTGFKGSWLSLWLAELGATVTGYALEPPTDPSNFVVSKVEECLEKQEVADVRDASRLSAAIDQANPDLIIHLAAQSVVKTGYESPLETFDINVMGTACLLEAVRLRKAPCAVLVVTSDKCYENTERVWGYRECDAMGDYDPYGGSKGAAEMVVRSYRNSFFSPQKIDQHGVRLASARAGNVIGGGDWTRHALIVDVFKALSRDQNVEIRSPHATRPWQHVLQCLSGYLTIAARLMEGVNSKICSGWNIGPLPGSELPVYRIVQEFIKTWGSGGWIDASDASQLREAHILRLSIDKALWELGWKPLWDSDEAVQQTAAWFRSYLENPNNMRDISLQQIELYQQQIDSADEEAAKADHANDVNRQVSNTLESV